VLLLTDIQRVTNLKKSLMELAWKQ